MFLKKEKKIKIKEKKRSTFECLFVPKVTLLKMYGFTLFAKLCVIQCSGSYGCMGYNF